MAPLDIPGEFEWAMAFVGMLASAIGIVVLAAVLLTVGVHQLVFVGRYSDPKENEDSAASPSLVFVNHHYKRIAGVMMLLAVLVGGLYEVQDEHARYMYQLQPRDFTVLTVFDQTPDLFERTMNSTAHNAWLRGLKSNFMATNCSNFEYTQFYKPGPSDSQWTFLPQTLWLIDHQREFLFM